MWNLRSASLSKPLSTIELLKLFFKSSNQDEETSEDINNKLKVMVVCTNSFIGSGAKQILDLWRVMETERFIEN